MAALANVVLTDSFDTWRVRTNQIIVKLDQLETNAVNIVSNTSVITVSGRGTIGNTVYITSNAFPTTGGTITGNVTITTNLTSGNVTVLHRLTSNNINVSANLIAGNIIVTGVLDLL